MLRGFLGAGNALGIAVNKVVGEIAKDGAFNLPHDFKLSELMWVIDGEVKELVNCSKEELLYVIFELCKKLPSADSDKCLVRYV